MSERMQCFFLEREWLNYKYTPLTRAKAEILLHRAIVKDSVCLENAFIMRLYIKIGDREILMKAEPGVDSDGMQRVEYASADILKDRLPGHEMPVIRQWGIDLIAEARKQRNTL